MYSRSLSSARPCVKSCDVESTEKRLLGVFITFPWLHSQQSRTTMNSTRQFSSIVIKTLELFFFYFSCCACPQKMRKKTLTSRYLIGTDRLRLVPTPVNSRQTTALSLSQPRFHLVFLLLFPFYLCSFLLLSLSSRLFLTSYGSSFYPLQSFLFLATVCTVGTCIHPGLSLSPSYSY